MIKIPASNQIFDRMKSACSNQVFDRHGKLIRKFGELRDSTYLAHVPLSNLFYIGRENQLVRLYEYDENCMPTSLRCRFQRKNFFALADNQAGVVTSVIRLSLGSFLATESIGWIWDELVFKRSFPDRPEFYLIPQYWRHNGNDYYIFNLGSGVFLKNPSCDSQIGPGSINFNSRSAMKNFFEGTVGESSARPEWYQDSSRLFDRKLEDKLNEFFGAFGSVEYKFGPASPPRDEMGRPEIIVYRNDSQRIGVFTLHDYKSSTCEFDQARLANDMLGRGLN